MEVFLGWLAAVLNLRENEVLPCSLPKADEGLLLTGRGTKTQTGHKYFVVMDGESLGYMFTVTGEVSAHVYVTPWLHVYVHHNNAQKKLLR